jgi:hypothetical protein
MEAAAAAAAHEEDLHTNFFSLSCHELLCNYYSRLLHSRSSLIQLVNPAVHTNYHQ